MRNLLWQAASHSRVGVLHETHFPTLGLDAVSQDPGDLELDSLSTHRDGRLAAADGGSATEPERIAELLRKYHGNRRRAAAELGISERTLYRKLNRYGFR